MCQICGIAASEKWTPGALEDALSVARVVGYDVYERALWLVGGDHPDDTEVAALNAVFYAATAQRDRAMRIIHSAESRVTGSEGIFDESRPFFTREELARIMSRPGTVTPINRLPAFRNGSEMRFMGIDTGKDDKTAVSFVRADDGKIIFESVLYGEKEIDKALSDALIYGEGKLRIFNDELTVNMIPMQFEDEENVGGPYSKLDEKPPEAPLDDPEARAKKEEADRAALRKRIDEVMGWKE